MTRCKDSLSLVLLTLALASGPVSCASPTAAETASDGVAVGAGASSSGYLAHSEAYLDPFCHAARLGSDAIVTATWCATRDAPTWLSFADGAGHETPVARARRRVTHDDPLTVLELVREHPGVAAPIAPMPHVGDVVDATTFAPTERPDGPPPATAWSGVVTETKGESFVAELIDGAPSCHGEMGAAVFLRGHLAGVLVGTRSGGPIHPDSPSCVTRYAFVHPAGR